MRSAGKTGMFRALARLGRTAAGGEAAATRSGPTRREVVKGALAGLALAPFASGCGDDLRPPGPPIAIIGGGVAGLHAAYQLQLGGLSSTVYEASGRTGGRMYTARGMFPDGQIAELGGELIDTGHTTIQGLAAHFELALDDLHADETSHGVTGDQFHFDGAFVDDAAIVKAFTPVAAKMAKAAMAAETDDAEFARIDAMSIPEWLEKEAGLAKTAMIRRLLEMAYLGEYGLEVAEQSAWNLLYLIGWMMPDPFEVFGESDETYHLHEGSQSIPDALAGAIGDRAIEREHRLVAIGRRGDFYTLTFDTAGGTRQVRAAHVVLTLPFTMLREVDLGGVTIPDDKQQVIDELGYGSNAKLMGSFQKRAWRDHKSGGSSVTDVGQLQATWDTARGQGGPSGLLTNFVGGARGVAIGDGTAEDRMTEALPWIDTLYPGAKAAYVAGSAVRQHWPTAPFHKASYACYKPGQWAFSGLEGARVGDLHFAGEHCSQDFQGYMEGGAETGAMAAAEILDDLGLAHPMLLRALIAPRLARPQGAYHASMGARLHGPRRWLRRR